MRGKLIVIYGPNNLGKSTQVELLEKTLKKLKLKVKRIKYPIYNLKPTGPKINSVLREGVKMPELELQKLFAQNRRDFQPKLEDLLSKGAYVIAEDYIGTGIAWGMTWGVKLSELEKINADLLKEDMAIVLDGERFRQGIEKTHKNEIDDRVWQKSRDIHQKLGKRYGWKKIGANHPVEDVQEMIVKILQRNQIF